MSLFRPREQRSNSWGFEPPISPVYQGNFGGVAGAPNMDTSLQNDAVWACVRLMADIVSMLPLQGYAKRGQVRTLLEPQPSLLVKPQDDADTPEWVWMVVASLMLRGNAYARIIVRDSYGYPVSTELLNPDKVKPFRDDAGRRAYRLDPQTVVRAEDMLHIRAFRMPGAFAGLSPIAYHALTINTDAAATRFGLGFFEDGAHPSAVLSSDQVIDQSKASEIKARFLAAVRGREPAVLGAGVTYTAISVKPEESQFLATQKYGATKIARIFGLPPEMIGAESGNSMTYANVEQRSIQMLTYSVQPWLTRIESALSQVLPGRQHVRFDVDELLRTDHETLAKSTAIRIASKQLTPDESRLMFDLPPLTQDQMNLLELVPLTVTPSGMAKSTQASMPVVDDSTNDSSEGSGNGK